MHCTDKHALHHNSIAIDFHVYFQPFPHTLVYIYDNILFEELLLKNLQNFLWFRIADKTSTQDCVNNSYLERFNVPLASRLEGL